jgi:uncharacterized RDD family membrane protein YckC
LEETTVYQPQQFNKIRYAGFLIRLVAYIVDSIVMCFIFIGIMTIFGVSWTQDIYFNSPDDYNMSASLMPNLILIAIGWLYFALMESGPNQATLGKMAIGIKVTDINGNRISFPKATGRFFSKIVSTLILFIGYLMVIWDPKKQALHDKLAGTLVIHKMMM